MYDVLVAAKDHYEKLLKMHDLHELWHVHADEDGSLVIEFSPDPKDQGFVARIVHITKPNKPGDGYFILFLWDALHSGALGVIEQNSQSKFEPSYFAKHLMAYAEHLRYDKEAGTETAFRYLLTDFGGLFCREVQDPKRHLTCKHID